MNKGALGADGHFITSPEIRNNHEHLAPYYPNGWQRDKDHMTGKKCIILIRDQTEHRRKANYLLKLDGDTQNIYSCLFFGKQL